MKDTELFDWLTQEAMQEDIAKLIQLTVANEITNLDESFTCDDPQAEFNWQELVLAGSLLARSQQRIHQEGALRIATAAVDNHPFRLFARINGLQEGIHAVPLGIWRIRDRVCQRDHCSADSHPVLGLKHPITPH